MVASLRLCWLGTAGTAWRVGESDAPTLLIDPFVTRFALARTLMRVASDAALVAAHVPRGDFVLVSHAHWDHLLDVPNVVRRDGAVVYGSPQTCALLALHGVPAAQRREWAVGVPLTLGPFTVTAWPAEHFALPGGPPFSGPLGTGLRLPLRPVEYRMDACWSFLLEVDGVRILDWRSEQPGPAPAADILLVMPHKGRAHYAALCAQVRPRIVIPNHWDDFFRPLSLPLRASLTPPRWQWPPLARMDVAGFARGVPAFAPGAVARVPVLGQWEVVG